jgi:RNA polymerase sigma-70 factor, ECF subfamily
MGERLEPDDAVLVQLSLGGDSGAYGELVGRYQRIAHSIALGITRRHEDAEDATQEAFIVALQRLEECRNPEKFGGWLLAIVRNRARNLLRRESLRSGEELPMSVPTKAPGPDRVTERVELRDRLQIALATLTEVQREVVLLHDLEGWKHREIAQLLEIPAGTVRSHLHYARKRLREVLAEPLEENE